MNSIEKWRPVEGHPHYEVSSHGRVRTQDRKVAIGMGASRFFPAQILRQWPGAKIGYMQVQLSGHRRVSVHRIVARAFCDGYFDGAVVNHKNGVRTDNRVENLEWVTVRENALHGFRVLGRITPTFGKFSRECKTSKPVVCTSIATGASTFYWCAKDAVRQQGFDSGSISRCCRGLLSYHKGHKWRFATDAEIARAQCDATMGVEAAQEVPGWYRDEVSV